MYALHSHVSFIYPIHTYCMCSLCQALLAFKLGFSISSSFKKLAFCVCQILVDVQSAWNIKLPRGREFFPEIVASHTPFLCLLSKDTIL